MNKTERVEVNLKIDKEASAIGGVEFDVDLAGSAAWEAARDLATTWAGYEPDEKLKYVVSDVNEVCARLQAWGEALLQRHATFRPGLKELLSQYAPVNAKVTELKFGEDLLDQGYGAKNERGVPSRNWPCRIVRYDPHPQNKKLGRLRLETLDPIVYPTARSSLTPVAADDRIWVLRRKS